MENKFIEGKIFTNADFVSKPIPEGEYEDCKFNICTLSGHNFSKFIFTDCEFYGCDLSNIKVNNSAFRNVKFTDCKLMGIHFENCNEILFSAYFEKCILKFSSFYKLKIKKTRFIKCDLQEVDFTEADLTDAFFDNCDLTKTTFENTVLERADFRTAFNYSIDPESNRVKKAKFSKESLVGLLDKYELDIE